eukprot:746988_1
MCADYYTIMKIRGQGHSIHTPNLGGLGGELVASLPSAPLGSRGLGRKLVARRVGVVALVLDHSVESVEGLAAHGGRTSAELDAGGFRVALEGDHGSVRCRGVRHGHEGRRPRDRLRQGGRPLCRYIVSALVQPPPYLDEERPLVPERHLGPFAVVEVPEVAEPALDVPGAALALEDMTVDDIEGLGGVGHCLDAAGEEPT